MINNTFHADNELNRFGYVPKLFRTLNTWQLVSFGLTYLQPIGPAVVFGILLTTSKGTVALPYLVAFIGMIFTILSYSTLIKEFPLSGSVYNYAKIILGPFFGFMAGWLLALDYILIPTVTSAFAAIYAHQLMPSIRYEIWLVIFVLSTGLTNIIGIKTSSFLTSFILIIQLLIVLFGFVIWINFILNNTRSITSLFSIKPFHFDSLSSVIQASAIAIFSFLGFDAVTTLAEESMNPRKDIPKAMLLCTLIGFFIMFTTGYLGVLVIPNWHQLVSDSESINSALFLLAKLTGGNTFALIYSIGFILAMIISNLVGITAVTRLLYSMGRDKMISSKIFGSTNKRWKTPHQCIIFIIILELFLGMLVNIDFLAELISYGAITGFIILNLSVIFLGYKLINKKIQLTHISYNKKQKYNFFVKFFVFPGIALLVMLSIFFNMKSITIIAGTLWGIAGVFYYIIFNLKFISTKLITSPIIKIGKK